MSNNIVTNSVALYSKSNLHKFGIGSLSKGYNIVKEEESDIWLNHKGVRLAPPEELAEYYGIKK